MNRIIPPLPAPRNCETMAQREKAYFLDLDARNKRALRHEKLKRLRSILPF